jgi:hypothetical protein
VDIIEAAGAIISTAELSAKRWAGAYTAGVSGNSGISQNSGSNNVTADTGVDVSTGDGEVESSYSSGVWGGGGVEDQMSA